MRFIAAWSKELMMNHVSSGMIAWLFGVTGPLLIVLQSAAKGGLPASAVSSWVFAIYVTGGVLTVVLSAIYRQPIAFAFSIPGAVLVGTTLANHPFEAVVGAYVATGVLVLVLGLSGTVEKAMRLIPLPIMMGMVSGVLLPFGIDIILSLSADPLVNGMTLLSFLLLSSFAAIARKIPPILGAIIVAAILLRWTGSGSIEPVPLELAVPQWVMPKWDFGVIGELVVPLSITVIGIQNAQGIGVLRGANYHPPVRAMTNWSGIGSIFNAFLGAHSACIAGPMTAIISNEENGEAKLRYYGALVMGVAWIAFGLMAPTAVGFTESIPSSLVKLLGGLAMIGVLTQSLQMSFAGSHRMGAIFAFIITLSQFTAFQIGAPFWGLVGGMAASYLLERRDWRKTS